jgi:SAM-dependent methyltransferase
MRTLTPESPVNAVGADVAATNRHFYDSLWSGTELLPPERFNTWPLISALTAGAPGRLEIGPGMRPRLPIGGTCFIDISVQAIERLNALGANAITATPTALPFASCQFELVCAFDVIEHIADDVRVFGEISRVLKDDGTLVLSVPLHRANWTDFDVGVGHFRRYDPQDLRNIIAAHELVLEQSATFGMQPKSRFLVRVGMWMLQHARTRALRWYNRVLPWAIYFQKPLAFAPGLIDGTRVSEVVVVCRRKKRLLGC